jgi:hypothetical protein
MQPIKYKIIFSRGHLTDLLLKFVAGIPSIFAV